MVTTGLLFGMKKGELVLTQTKPTALAFPRGQALTTDPTSPGRVLQVRASLLLTKHTGFLGRELKVKAKRETVEQLLGFSDP